MNIFNMNKKETTTQRKRRLEKKKLKRQEEIANESDVHKRQRLEKTSLASAKYRENESLEQRTIRQDIDRNHKQERRKNELEEEHLARLERRNPYFACVKKRIEESQAMRRSRRSSTFDSTRDLSPCEEPAPTKVDSVKERLAKYKKEKEIKKKEEAAKKKKPFWVGTAVHNTLYYMPPPPPRAFPSTSSRVTRSQAAKNTAKTAATQQLNKTQSFAPENAQFRPPKLKSGGKLPTLAPLSQTRHKTTTVLPPKKPEIKPKINRKKVEEPNKKFINPAKNSTKATTSEESYLSSDKELSEKSPKHLLFTSEQIEDDKRRPGGGKSNKREEMKLIYSEGLMEPESVDYFPVQLHSEIARLTETCDSWENVLEQTGFAEHSQDAIRTAVGEARLLMSKTMQQFAEVKKQCAHPSPGCPLVTPADLKGFCDMVFMQIVNEDLRFKKLEESLERGWEEEQPAAGEQSAKPAATSRLRDIIAASRKAKKEQSDVPSTPVSVVLAEAPNEKTGFSCLRSTVRSPPPRTPDTAVKNSLLKAVLSSEAYKASTSNIVNEDLRFKKLEESLERGWEEEQPAAGEQSAKPAATSRLRDIIAASRKAKKEQSDVPSTPVSVVLAEAPNEKTGFSCLRSTVRSPPPRTPDTAVKNSLLKAVLSSEAYKASTSNTFAMLQESWMAEHAEIGIEGIALLPQTPVSSVEMFATPVRSILKSTASASRTQSEKKKVVFKIESSKTSQASEMETETTKTDIEFDGSMFHVRKANNKTRILTRQDGVDVNDDLIPIESSRLSKFDSVAKNLSNLLANAEVTPPEKTPNKSAKKKDLLKSQSKKYEQDMKNEENSEEIPTMQQEVDQSPKENDNEERDKKTQNKTPKRTHEADGDNQNDETKTMKTPRSGNNISNGNKEQDDSTKNNDHIAGLTPRTSKRSMENKSQALKDVSVNIVRETVKKRASRSSSTAASTNNE